MDTKIIAMYFPQFHTIKENDEWWGAGFTDWENVKSGLPQYEGHNQPREPLANKYYDQSDISTIEWQVGLAKKYGIYGFCHYHYWFDGKQLLEKPTNLWLENKKIDFPFCLSWANETWSRRWDGKDYEVLLKQTHPANEDSWKKHFDYLIRFWKDPRAITVEGKPVFVIYKPENIVAVGEMIKFWQKLAKLNGLLGLYIIYQQSNNLVNRKHLENFDASFQFQPMLAANSRKNSSKLLFKTIMLQILQLLPEKYYGVLNGFKVRLRSQVVINSYDSTWERALEVNKSYHLTTYPGGFVDWDNTARYKNRATVFKGASPERFEYWFTKLLQTMKHRNLPESFIFLNAWNEWSEGAYLEPDTKYEYRYLEAIQRLIGK